MVNRPRILAPEGEVDGARWCDRKLRLDSFADLVAHQAPKTFRDFLLSAPYMFLELGEKLGAISHIVSFWRYRFPSGASHAIDGDELSAIFQDFSSGFGEKLQGESSVIKKPMVIDTTAA